MRLVGVKKVGGVACRRAQVLRMRVCAESTNVDKQAFGLSCFCSFHHTSDLHLYPSILSSSLSKSSLELSSLHRRPPAPAGPVFCKSRAHGATCTPCVLPIKSTYQCFHIFVRRNHPKKQQECLSPSPPHA